VHRAGDGGCVGCGGKWGLCVGVGGSGGGEGGGSPPFALLDLILTRGLCRQYLRLLPIPILYILLVKFLFLLLQ
jgi:hypothetical protein